MRKMTESFLILLVCIVGINDYDRIASLIPLILLSLILTLILINSNNKILPIVCIIGFIGASIRYPELSKFIPLLMYSSFWHNKYFPILFLVPILIHPDISVIFIGIIAVYMAWREYNSSIMKESYLSMRDTYRQNELLQQRIASEHEELFEKNIDIAVLEERNRISRELHDSVGHTISSSLMQVEALSLISEGKVKEKLEALSLILSSGMDDIRASIHNMHNESIRLEKIIDDLTAPMKERFTVERDLQLSDDVPPGVKRVMETVIKEALTNISKHSDGDDIKLIIRELPNHFTLTVKDNGKSKPVRKDGMGLKNMSEAVRNEGGYFTTGYNEGFYIHTTLPKNQSQDEVK